MKKALSLFLIICMLFTFASCEKAQDGDKNQDSSFSQAQTTSSESEGGLGEVVEFEKPNTANTAILYNPQKSSYDEISEKKRLEIVNCKEDLKPTENTRYVSYRGDDKNDGKTPQTAWASLGRLVGEECDTVLFERGGIYRGLLKIESDKSYGAYGDGPKPTFYTGKQNYADASLWRQTSVDNIWAVRVGSVTDIGNVIFNDGEKICLKMLNTYKNLTADYQFYHHRDNGVLYVYSTQGNPGELYNSIEIAYGHGIRANVQNTKNVVIDNLCVKYSGWHGISFITGADNIKISNCEIGYIGGSMTDNNGRLGNGIEFVNSYSNCTVTNCWIYQCYDAGYTFQNCSLSNPDLSKRLKEENMVFTDSLVEYCNYNIEIFGPDTGLVKNALFENNICRFAGFGWGTINRIGSNPDASSNLGLYKGNGKGWLNSESFVIKNNVFDTARYSLVACALPNNKNGRGPTITGNTYIQTKVKTSYAAMVLGNEQDVSKVMLPAGSQAEFEASIKKFDTAPKAVVFY